MNSKVKWDISTWRRRDLASTGCLRTFVQQLMKRMCESVRVVSCHHKPTCKRWIEPLKRASVDQQLYLLKDSLWQSPQGRGWDFQMPYSLFSAIYTMVNIIGCDFQFCVHAVCFYDRNNGCTSKSVWTHFFAWLCLLRVIKTLLPSCDFIPSGSISFLNIILY